jgi:hypothetical protein
MTKPVLFLFLSLLIGFFRAGAQTAAPAPSVEVVADKRVGTLVEKHTEINQRGKSKGYRVQIYFGSDKAKAKEMKAKFLNLYGREMRAYEPYEQPNFKIRVGDFRTRMEAYRFWKKIKADFPTAFIVESDIEPGEEHTK